MTLSTEHLMWIVLAAVVLFVLFKKGYLRWPAMSNAVPAVFSSTSEDLGELLALQAQREAQRELAQEFARDSAKRLREQYKSPFADGAPTPSPPNG